MTGDKTENGSQIYNGFTDEQKQAMSKEAPQGEKITPDFAVFYPRLCELSPPTLRT